MTSSTILNPASSLKSSYLKARLENDAFHSSILRGIKGFFKGDTCHLRYDVVISGGDYYVNLILAYHLIKLGRDVLLHMDYTLEVNDPITCAKKANYIDAYTAAKISDWLELNKCIENKTDLIKAMLWKITSMARNTFGSISFLDNAGLYLTSSRDSRVFLHAKKMHKAPPITNILQHNLIADAFDVYRLPSMSNCEALIESGTVYFTTLTNCAKRSQDSNALVILPCAKEVNISSYDGIARYEKILQSIEAI